MAIINITPDSFSDGGEAFTPDAAMDRIRLARDQGAAILDLGGESTRPGAARVPPIEQAARVLPVIRAARREGIDLPISIDTTRAEVARAAIDAGADIINDVSAGLDDPAMIPLAAERSAGLILMHRLRPPSEDVYSNQYERAPVYAEEAGGVVGVVRSFLKSRAEDAVRAGVNPESIVLDPGLGFGKSVAQNHELIQRIDEIQTLGFPVLSAASRKSFLSSAPGDHPKSRDAASVAVTVAHRRAGIRLFRVHNVAAHIDALHDGPT
ncbi:MAG: dihydropteroate synthase [Phycisphaerae bacterium]|nr:dihydropteroate synthase [Phycisphaerae bacterium]